MEKKKLAFRKSLNLSLHVFKNKKGLFADLSLNDKVFKTCLSNEFSIDISQFEGQILEVVLINREVMYKGMVITVLNSLFNKGLVIDCTIGKTKENIYYHLGDEILYIEKVTDKIAKIFENRNSFKVKVLNENDFYIIRYTPLHVHTDNTFCKSILSVDTYADNCEYAGAITDTDNLYGYLDFYKAMKKKGKKPIIGGEFSIDIGERLTDTSVRGVEVFKKVFDVNFKERYDGDNIVILAKNDIGLSNLIRLSTDAQMNLVQDKPYITFDMLSKYKEGLIVLSGGLNSPICKSMLMLRSENEDVVRANKQLIHNFLNYMKDTFDEDFYVEVHCHEFPLETELMNEVRDLAKKYQVKTVATTNTHYLLEDDARYQELWLTGYTKQSVFTQTQGLEGRNYHLLTSKEIVNFFTSEELDRTLEISDKCDVKIEFTGYHMPKFPLPKEFTDNIEYFKHRVREGFKSKFLGTEKFKSQEYIDRVKFEMDIIVNMGYSDYFLIVADYLKYAEDDNVRANIEDYFPSHIYNLDEIPAHILDKPKCYTGAGRGSCVGSLICYLLDITKLDPIQYGLLFERFLNPDRVSMPDVDSDFEDTQRDMIMEYCRYKYNVKNVSKIITFTTASTKEAVLSMIRAFGITKFEEQRQITALIPAKASSISQAIEESEDLKVAMEQDPQIKEIINSALKVEGLKKNVSIHASAIIIADNPIYNYIPEVRIFDKKSNDYQWTAGLSGPSCEEMGLLKMDFLGLKTLGIVHNTIDLVRKYHNVNLKMLDIPINDVNAYKLLSEGHTVGVFQVESNSFTKTIADAFKDVDKVSGDTLFSRLYDITALVRPGPMQYIPKYVDNIYHPDHVTYKHEIMKEVLSQTNGIILFQEQVMTLVRKLAGFSRGQSDTIRKAMGKKIRELIEEYRDYFIYGSKEKNILGCVNNGIDEDLAKDIWADMETFAEYGFNKSHAVAYTWLTSVTAYLSCYYPVEYYTSILNYADNVEDIELIINKIKDRGIAVLPPDVQKSEIEFTPEGNNIRYGLTYLKNVSSMAKNLIEMRKTHMIDTYEKFIMASAEKNALNKQTLEAFIYSGMLDRYQGNRATKIKNLEYTLNFIKEYKDFKDEGNMFDLFSNKKYNFKLEEQVDEFSFEEIATKEKEYTGFFITAHPLDDYRWYLNSIKCGNIHKAVSQVSEGSKTYSSLAGVVTSAEKRRSKSGNTFYTFTIDDGTGSLTVRVFPENNLEFKDIHEGTCVYFAKVQIEDNSFGLGGVAKTVSAVKDIAVGNFKSVRVKFENKADLETVEKDIKHNLDIQEDNKKCKTEVFLNKKLLGFTTITLGRLMFLYKEYGRDNVFFKHQKRGE